METAARLDALTEEYTAGLARARREMTADDLPTLLDHVARVADVLAVAVGDGVGMLGADDDPGGRGQAALRAEHVRDVLGW